MQLSQLSHKSLDKIYTKERSKKKFTLTNLKKFLRSLDNPQDNLNAIHVAGTNGKGSVCAMLSNTLTKAGHTVGLFTSPHILSLNERIKVDNKDISDQDFKRIEKQIEALPDSDKLSFFERLYVIAIIYFIEKGVDYTILEVGLGGRLDATNLCNPILTIITNVSLDHQEFLGNTIEKIAKEKAGIIKKGVPVITNCKGKSLSVIKAVAEKKKAKLIKAKKVDLELSLKGDFQKENANTAYTALKKLKIDEDVIKKGIKEARWPIRFDFVKKKIMIDAAHNPAGIKAMVESAKKLDYENIYVIFGTMKDKDVSPMAKELKSLTRNIVLTKAKMTNANEPEDISKFFDISVITHDLKHALLFTEKFAKPKDLVIITGSIFLASEAYQLLK